MTLKGALTIPVLVLLVTGIVMMFRALKYRTERHPGIPTFDPRNWKPFWYWKDWYTQPGYRLAVMGASLVTLSAVLSLITYLAL